MRVSNQGDGALKLSRRWRKRRRAAIGSVWTRHLAPRRRRTPVTIVVTANPSRARARYVQRDRHGREFHHRNEHCDSCESDREHAGSGHPFVAASAVIHRRSGRRRGTGQRLRGEQYRPGNDGLHRVHANARGRPAMAVGDAYVERDHQRANAGINHGHRESDRPRSWILLRAGARGFRRGRQHAANGYHRAASAACRSGPGTRD